MACPCNLHRSDIRKDSWNELQDCNISLRGITFLRQPRRYTRYKRRIDSAPDNDHSSPDTTRMRRVLARIAAGCDSADCQTADSRTWDFDWALKCDKSSFIEKFREFLSEIKVSQVSLSIHWFCYQSRRTMMVPKLWFKPRPILRIKLVKRVCPEGINESCSVT